MLDMRGPELFTLLCIASLTLWCGRTYAQNHPVLDHGVDPARAADYEAAVARVMSMSEEEMLSFVPDRPVVRFCYCPNCHGGSQGSNVFTWSIDNPDQITCRYCGTVYPNERFPQDHTITGVNALGEEFTYHYHQDREREDLRIFIDGHILYFKRQWIVAQLQALGRAWLATKKPEYARRAVLILDRIAQVYPHYPVMRQWITTFDFAPSQQPPYPAAGGKWGRWMESELPAGVIEGWDMVYDSPAVAELSAERGYDVREHINTNFFRATFDYVNTFERHDNNMSPFYLRTAIHMGRVIGEPRYVHWAYRWLMEILHGGCFYDGTWHEAPSYHYQVMGGLKRAFNALVGYSDPEGYVDPEDGTHFDDLTIEDDLPFFARAQDAFAAVALPDGTTTPVHDTWPNQRRHEPTESASSALLPGYGHASLGCGVGAHQTLAQLHFSGSYGHTHLDCLNLSLYAHEREMSCDIGYTHTRARWWTICTTGHNLVTIDRRQQASGASDGDLLRFFPDVGGLAMVEADGRRAYREVEDLETYRRMIVLVPISDKDAYVVDLFAVDGGRQHDWLLHGDADADMTASCDIDLPRELPDLLEEGESWQEPLTEQSRFIPWGAIRDVRAGPVDGDVTVHFRYADAPDTGLAIYAPALTGEVLLGRCPSVRRAKDESMKAFDFWMPQLVLRRTASADEPLRSLFAVVEAPFSGEPAVQQVTRLEVEPSDYAVALQVRHAAGLDTIIATLAEPPYSERIAGDVRLTGRLGIVREQASEVIGMWLFEGTSLQYAEAGVTSPTACLEGTITGALRVANGAQVDAFLTDAALPEGDDLHGRWMIVTHPNGYTHGYEIDRIERRSDDTLIVLTSDHGLRIDGDTTREVFFPRREFSGPNTFTIPLAVSVIAQ